MIGHGGKSLVAGSAGVTRARMTRVVEEEQVRLAFRMVRRLVAEGSSVARGTLAYLGGVAADGGRNPRPFRREAAQQPSARDAGDAWWGGRGQCTVRWGTYQGHAD